MDEEQFNQSIRKFLKVVGVTSQREIEKRVREALDSGQLKGIGELPVHATVTLGDFGTVTETEGKISIA